MVGLALMLVPPANAQVADRPLLLPSRDVAVVYKIEGLHRMDEAQKLQVTYTKAGERTRVDYFRWLEAKYPFMAVIFDRPADRLIAILPERKAYLERQVAKAENPGAFLMPGTRFTRQGTATVANTQCTEWTFRPADKEVDAGTACIDDNGLLLRLAWADTSNPSLTATVVAYGAPPDGVFVPPPDYARRTQP